MTEDELRQRICESEKDGFHALFQQYATYVYSIVWGHIRTIGTAEDAEECVSDVFAEVFLHFGDIQSGCLKAYIGTIAKRTAIHRYRILSATCSHLTEQVDFAEIADEQNIEAESDKHESYRELYEQIRLLPEPDKTIVIQRYFYCKKATDIAKAMGMTPVAVRVRLNRTLKRLRKQMLPESEQTETKG